MHAGHVIKCVTSLNTSNSTKTQSIDDMSYQTFVFPSRKLRPQRTSASRETTFSSRTEALRMVGYSPG